MKYTKDNILNLKFVHHMLTYTVYTISKVNDTHVIITFDTKMQHSVSYRLSEVLNYFNRGIWIPYTQPELTDKELITHLIQALTEINSMCADAVTVIEEGKIAEISIKAINKVKLNPNLPNAR